MLKVNEIRIVYKAAHLKDRPKLTSSLQAQELFYENWTDDIDWRESFYVAYLSTSNRVKGLQLMSVGGINSTTVDIRMIFGTALKCMATCIIMAHNHPSGDSSPSPADKKLTERVAEAGKLLDITLMDHIILEPDGEYFSFADHGLL